MPAKGEPPPARDVDELLLVASIARRTSEALRGSCRLALVSSDGEWLHPVAAVDVSAASHPSVAKCATDAPIRIDAGASAEQRLERFLREDDPGDHDPGRRTVLFVPIRLQGETIGGFTIVRRGRDASAFGDADVQLAETLAEHAAVALTNGRLFATVRRELAEREKLAARLRQIGDAAHEFAEATDDYRGLLLLVARRLSQVVGAGAAVRMVAEDGAVFEPLLALEDPDPDRAVAVFESMREPQRIGEGVTGRVAFSGKSLFIPVITEDHLASIEQRYRSIIERTGLRGIVAVPLHARGRVIGVASVYRGGRDRPYTEDDQQLVEGLAAHAAVAIANSRLLRAAHHELDVRRRREEALHRTDEQIRHSQKMEAVGRLAGSISHDFNNLLSVILSYCSLLIDEMSSDDPVRAELEEIQKAGERAATLTRQLLAFSRQQILEPRILDLTEVVAGMERMIRRVLGEDVALSISHAERLGRVKADPGHLEQVILNLVVNARDAMPGGGTLTVRIQMADLEEPYARERLGVSPGPHVVLSVGDTGTGMDRATQERLFEPFFTTKPRGKGTGLGLATVFGIVRQSGGTIQVQSELGRGTTFEVYLPCTDEALSDVAPPRAPVGTLGGSETILLVEDEEQVLVVAMSVLRRSGYHILEARSGPEALEVAAKHAGRIDLVVTDVVMPLMGGRQLAERLRMARPGLRVLYMSGYAEEAIAEQCLAEPDVALLQKPLTPDMLLRGVREILTAPAAPPLRAPLD